MPDVRIAVTVAGLIGREHAALAGVIRQGEAILGDDAEPDSTARLQTRATSVSLRLVRRGDHAVRDHEVDRLCGEGACSISSLATEQIDERHMYRSLISATVTDSEMM